MPFFSPLVHHLRDCASCGLGRAFTRPLRQAALWGRQHLAALARRGRRLRQRRRPVRASACTRPTLEGLEKQIAASPQLDLMVGMALGGAAFGGVAILAAYAPAPEVEIPQAPPENRAAGRLAPEDPALAAAGISPVWEDLAQALLRGDEGTSATTPVVNPPADSPPLPRDPLPADGTRGPALARNDRNPSGDGSEAAAASRAASGSGSFGAFSTGTSAALAGSGRSPTGGSGGSGAGQLASGSSPSTMGAAPAAAAGMLGGGTPAIANPALAPSGNTAMPSSTPNATPPPPAAPASRATPPATPAPPAAQAPPPSPAAPPAGQTAATTAATPASGSRALDPDPLQFAMSTFMANEGVGNAPIMVTRTGDPSATVSVQYATSDGTARAGIDYVATSGTLTFPPNTISQTFNVNVLDDNQTGEPATETVNLTLSNPVGVPLGSPATAILNINEDSDGGGGGGGGGGGTPLITNPGSQSSHEADAVSLQIQASDPGGTLYYGAAGLPAGLTIDSTSGLISGTLAYTDAETQLGSYSVNVSAYDGSSGNSASATFGWTVLDTRPAPVLANPGNQLDSEGDAVSLGLDATAPDGLPLTYSASGLPSGLSLNTMTGVISGVVASNAGGSSPYSTTVTATDTDGSTSQSFTWTVSHVQINGVGDQSNLTGDSVNLPMYAWTTSGHALTYSATGLPPGLTVNSSTGIISGTVSTSASLTTPYSVSVTASDGTDSAGTSFNWSIAALAVVDPGDQTNAEGDVVALPLGISDNSTNAVISWSASGLPAGLAINPTTGAIAGTIANLDANNSPYAVTVTANDGIHTASDTFNWYVTHILLTVPATQYSSQGTAASLQVQASDPDHDLLGYSASGLPSGLTVNAASGLISGTISNTAGGETPYAVTVTATDGGHSTSATFSWYVSNNAIPVTSPGTQSNAEGASVSLPISATDPNGDSMAFSASGLPSGLSIDPNSGVISGTVAQGDASGGGTYTVAVYADDLNGSQGSASFTWNISHTNTVPVVFNPGDQTDDQGDTVSLPVAAYDPDGDTLSFSASGLPAGLSINSSSGVVSGAITATAGTYSATVTASDGTLTGSQSFHWVVDRDVVTLTNPGGQTNAEGNAVSLQLAATDANHNSLTYGISGLPAGLSLNTSTGAITGTVSSGDSNGGNNGWYTLTATATDTQGYSAAQQFGWQITASPPAPVVTGPGTQINAQGDAVDLGVQASDPKGLTLSYSAAGLPSGLSINTTTGVISGIVSGTAAGMSPYAASVTVSNGTYQTTSNFTWDVTNQAVTITNPGTLSGTGGNAASLQISATDPNGYSLSYSAVGLPSGLSINATSGLISGTIAAAAGGQYRVTVMAGDSYRNSGSATFAWNVTYANQAPVLSAPGDQTDRTGDAVSLQLNGADPDGDTVTYSASGLPSGLSLNTTTGLISGTLSATASGSPYAVTVTASDGTLNANQTFHWYVTKDVVTVTNPGGQTNKEGDPVSLPVSASDANSSTLTYSATGLPGGLSINSTTGLISGPVSSGDAANGPYSVIVTATDTQGYAASQNFSWTVNPASDLPVLTKPGNQSNTEGDSVSLAVQATDPLGLPLTYAASGLPVGLGIDPTSGLISGTVVYSAAEVSGGDYTVVLSVDDGAGHTASQTFTWTVANKDQAPWLVYPGLQDTQVNTSASLQLQALDPEGAPLSYSATGLPSGLSLNTTTGLISGSPTALGTYTVTASVSDGVLSSSQTFGWDVTTAAQPKVILTINGSTEDYDHVDLLDPAEPLPLTVTLEDAGPGLTTVTLSVPSGRSAVSQPSVELANGGSITLTLTPLMLSQAPDDVVVDAEVANAILANAAATNTNVILDTKVVTDTDTPKAMVDDKKYRIPPGLRQTEVGFTIKVAVPDGSVMLKLIGGSAANGTAKFADGSTKDDTWAARGEAGGYLAHVSGVSQTKPGNAGGLHVALFVDGTQVVDGAGKPVQTEGFSVAAIPLTVTMGTSVPVKGYVPPPWDQNYPNLDSANKLYIRWGVVFPVTFTSDSGPNNVGDLSQITWREDVKLKGGGDVNVGGWQTKVQGAGDLNSVTEQFAWPVVGGVGAARKFAADKWHKQIDAKQPPDVYTQYFLFGDKRTGLVQAVVPNSGFTFTQTYKVNDNVYTFNISRQGAVIDLGLGKAQPGTITTADGNPPAVVIQ